MFPVTPQIASLLMQERRHEAELLRLAEIARTAQPAREGHQIDAFGRIREFIRPVQAPPCGCAPAVAGCQQ